MASLWLVCTPGLVFAAPLPSPTELMTKIDAVQKDLRSLRADFVQHSRVKLFRQQVSSEGRFLYAKGTPARLRWEYLKPDPSTMLLVGEQATL
ncbi:MAG TPA: outer membrane lipoprotein carrier protein LolA, partial [Pseudomonadota bacterium]|nr:outer membrane lipoprotein carrier protein LolA [Pseudomonadota bacterium]